MNEYEISFSHPITGAKYSTIYKAKSEKEASRVFLTQNPRVKISIKKLVLI